MRNLKQLASTNQLRIRRVQDTCAVNFASNDYLGLAQDKRVKKSFAAAAERYGLGSSGSALLSGFQTPHQELELAFAKYSGRERALLFNSGYHANLGIYASLANRHDTILADKDCHASILDGIQLSRASLKRYRHLDLKHATQLMHAKSMLVTESVFSMSGECSNIAALANLTKQHHGMLIVDDAHGLGVCENDFSQVEVLISPLGKALGSMGAVVSGKHDVIEQILQTARSYAYSTALPPAVCAASLTALEILAQETWRREQLHALCKFFVAACANRNIHLLNTAATPIKVIVIGDNARTMQRQQHLHDHGFCVAAIRPPTVAANTARIRVSLNIHHTREQIISLLDCMVAA